MKMRSSKRAEGERPEPNDRLRSFLSSEIEDIEKTLQPLKGAKASSLRKEVELRKERVESQEEDELSFLMLSSLRRDIIDLKERAEALATKPRLLERIPPPFWLALVPLVLVIYIVYLAFVQWQEKPQIQQFATQTAMSVQQTMIANPTATPAPGTPTATP